MCLVIRQKWHLTTSWLIHITLYPLPGHCPCKCLCMPDISSHHHQCLSNSLVSVTHILMVTLPPASSLPNIRATLAICASISFFFSCSLSHLNKSITLCLSWQEVSAECCHLILFPYPVNTAALVSLLATSSLSHWHSGYIVV